MTTAIVATAAAFMIAAEHLRPGRRWPRVPGWLLRAAALTSIQVAIVWLAAGAWDGWLLRHQLWSAERLGRFGGAALGYLAITFVYYWWHRARHASTTLWRWLHQLHHSPQRLEVVASFYKHPFEILLNGILSSVVLYTLVGLGPTSATAVVILTGLAELFYHWNVATPYWLGFVFQRPESHCVHHQEGLHHYNFSDLPLWDQLFGTFHNPRHFTARCGFGPGREERVADLLAGHDISSPALRGIES